MENCNPNSVIIDQKILSQANDIEFKYYLKWNKEYRPLHIRKCYAFLRMWLLEKRNIDYKKNFTTFSETTYRRLVGIIDEQVSLSTLLEFFLHFRPEKAELIVLLKAFGQDTTQVAVEMTFVEEVCARWVQYAYDERLDEKKLTAETNRYLMKLGLHLIK